VVGFAEEFKGKIFGDWGQGLHEKENYWQCSRYLKMVYNINVESEVGLLAA
jgi:hypothetical protein